MSSWKGRRHRKGVPELALPLEVSVARALQTVAAEGVRADCVVRDSAGRMIAVIDGKTRKRRLVTA